MPFCDYFKDLDSKIFSASLRSAQRRYKKNILKDRAAAEKGHFSDRKIRVTVTKMLAVVSMPFCDYFKDLDPKCSPPRFARRNRHLKKFLRQSVVEKGHFHY